MWFEVDPDSIEYGRAAALLPRMSDDFDKLGVRLRLTVDASEKLRGDFLAAYPEADQEGSEHKLSKFLATAGRFKRHFGTQFFALASNVITDLDSVSHGGRHPTVRVDTPNALTSNASLKTLLDVSTVQELIDRSFADKSRSSLDRAIVYLLNVLVSENASDHTMRPQKLEESFAYENFSKARSGDLSLVTRQLRRRPLTRNDQS